MVVEVLLLTGVIEQSCYFLSRQNHTQGKALAKLIPATFLVH